MRFLDIFLLHCLLSDSPPDNPGELGLIAQNKLRAAQRGRDPGLVLTRGKEELGLRDWGAQLLAECEPVAAALDGACGGAAYRDALAHAASVVKEPESAPSARVLHAMARNHGNSYVRFVHAMSLLHQGSLRGLPFPPEMERRFIETARESLAEQQRIEADDDVDFETYRRRYLSPELLKV
jgi:glutamate--cysteine ligase